MTEEEIKEYIEKVELKYNKDYLTNRLKEFFIFECLKIDIDRILYDLDELNLEERHPNLTKEEMTSCYDSVVLQKYACYKLYGDIMRVNNSIKALIT